MTRQLLRPIGGRLASVTSAGISRQRKPIVRTAVLIALALTFAVSTATFNSTYRAQAEADAQLTNGADVTVTEPPAAAVGAGFATRLRAVPGVRAVEPVQHRFAYVGTDLQDLYGVHPATIRSATALQDSYFSGASASSLMSTLQARPDSILVSAETVHDYQLHLGDTINLRLVDGRTHAQVQVRFHYVGIVAEFPTAPKDSFFIANADYISAATKNPAIGTFLVDTGGGNVTSVSAAIRSLVGTSAAVSDIATTRGAVGSSLTSVDLALLTRLELGFALVIAAAAAGLVVGLGLAERRRGLAIMRLLGARVAQLSVFVVAELALIGVCALLAGALLGSRLTQMLVKVLTGVFDPPPAALTVPWGYLGATVGLIIVGLTLTGIAGVVVARRSGPAELRGS